MKNLKDQMIIIGTTGNLYKDGRRTLIRTIKNVKRNDLRISGRVKIFGKIEQVFTEISLFENENINHVWVLSEHGKAWNKHNKTWEYESH